MGVSESILLLALIVGTGWVTKGRAAGHLNFYPGDVSAIQFDGVTPIITFGILVQNTSNVTLTLNSIAANVFSNGMLIGNISNFQPQYIQGNSQVVISVNGRMLLLGIVNDLIKAWQMGAYTQRIEINGQINADGIQVPIELKYQIG